MKLTIILVLLAVVVVVSATCKKGGCKNSGENNIPPCGKKGGCKHSGEKPLCGKKGGCGGNPPAGGKSSEENKSGGGKHPKKPPVKPCKKGGCGGGPPKSHEENDSRPMPPHPPTKPPCGKKGSSCGGNPPKSSEEQHGGYPPTKPPTSPTKPHTKPTRPPTKPPAKYPCGKKGGCGHGGHSTGGSDENTSGPVKPSPTKPTRPPTKSPTRYPCGKKGGCGHGGSGEGGGEPPVGEGDSGSSGCKQSSEEIAPMPYDEELYDTVSIAQSYNYPADNHEVITRDGFRIQIQRMQDSKKRKHRHPVLLIGDFWTSSLFWVISGKDCSLAVYLADLGYDVWMANDRGNRYGQSHVNFDIRHPSFWDYSFDKIGLYDLPAIIDYIIDYHRCEQISVIAWGYGATACFAMVSDRPEYSKKINSLQLLAPAVFMQNTQSQILLGLFKQDQQSIFNKIGRYEIIRNKNLLQKAGRPICRRNSPDRSYCDYFQTLFSASSIYGISNPYYPAVLNAPRSQGSVRWLMHMLQQVQSGCFRKFDYGLASNQHLYGSDDPPHYDLSAASMPIAVYYSNDDTLVVPKDVMILWSKIQNKIDIYCIKDPDFSHVHFALSPSAKDAFYGPVGEILARYN